MIDADDLLSPYRYLGYSRGAYVAGEIATDDPETRRQNRSGKSRIPASQSHGSQDDKPYDLRTRVSHVRSSIPFVFSEIAG